MRGLRKEVWGGLNQQNSQAKRILKAFYKLNLGGGLAGFDPQPSQSGEKKKRKKKSEKHLCPVQDLNPRPSDHQSCT